MSVYNRLIRMTKNDLDEKRKLLSAAQKIVSDYEQELISLIKQHDYEMELAAQNPIYTGNLSSILLKYKNDDRVLRNRINDSKNKALEIENLLLEAFRQHKTYELAHETVKAREATDLRRKEQATMDEIGIQKHYRRT